METKKEIIKTICLDSIKSITDAFEIEIEDIEIKNVEDLAKGGHRKTYLDLKKNIFIKHYLILDTGKILSIPVFAIKDKKEKVIFRPCSTPFRRNIGLLEIIKKDENEKKAILYIGNVRRNLYC